MRQWGFFLDQTRCIGCKTCILACQAWNEDERGDAALYPDLSWQSGLPHDPVTAETHEANDVILNRYRMKEQYRHVLTTEHGRWPDVDVVHDTVSCGHCENPACIAVCPTGHLYKDTRYGLVLQHKEKQCIGCTLCKQACPFDAPQFYDDPKQYAAGAKPPMRKCDLCIDRIEAGDKPACVAGCRMRALDAGPLDELLQKYPDATRAEGDDIDRSPKTNAHVNPHHYYRRKKPR